MSNHLHDESRRKKQVKLRVGVDLVERFDEWVEASAHDSRSDAIRQFMVECVDDPEPERDGRVPPADPDLREAWFTLLNLRSKDGWVTEGRALPTLAQEHNMEKKVVRHSLIKPLEQRGYLKQQAGRFGRFISYKVYE